MDELVRQAIATVRGMWQRRWFGLAAAWIVGIAAGVAVMQIPDKYEATARIYVDTQSVLRPLMQGLAVQPNIEQQVTMLSRTLISRPNVEKLVRMADLDLTTRSSRDQEAMIDELMKTLRINGTGRDNLYTLSYRDSNPEKSKRVVQSLVSIFVESSLGGKRKDTESAKKFLDDQIRSYEKKLQDAEDRLKEFRIRNINLVGGDGRDYFTRIRDVNAALQQARLDLREAENSRDALKRQIAGEDEPAPSLLPDSGGRIARAPAPGAAASTPAPSTGEGERSSAQSSSQSHNGDPGVVAVPGLDVRPSGVPGIDGRIETLRRNLDVLRLRYTDEHPDIVAIKRVLDDLEAQRAKEIASRPRTSATATAAGGGAIANPVTQQLKISLAEAEANVASLRTRVAEFEGRAAQLRDAAKLVPQVEAELTQLMRDYEVNKKNYETLVQRRESAELSSEMEAVSGVADFRLIDPPRVSPRPVAPNRMLLLAGALLGAIGAGLVASFAASQLRPTFFDASALHQVTSLPVLGSVSMIMTDTFKRHERRNLVGFASGVVVLLAGFGTTFAFLFMQSARLV